MNPDKKSLKILHLTTHLNVGGITSYVFMASKALRERGHQVSVLSAGGQREGDLAKIGIQCHRYGIYTKNILSPRLFTALPSVVRLIHRERFDVMHAHTRITQVLAADAGFFTKVPVVTTAHGYFKPGWGRKILPSWGRKVIAISGGVADDLSVNHGVPKENIRIVENAIDLEDSAARLAGKNRSLLRQEYGIADNAFVLCSVSRLVKDKGHEVLFRAIAALKDQIPGLALLLVGDGREARTLEKLAGDLGIAPKISWIKSSPDVTAPLAACDVFVHPATHREGFGLVIAEAMFAGKPVILTRIPALDTLFSDKKDCRMVPPSDPEALASVIAELYADPAECRYLIETGRRRAESDFSLNRWARQLEEVYQEVVKKT